ncbi:DUF5979 domain-containing protein [Corynebacterium pseudotuberculosis]|uniref:DUF5979 domain-containing protein n=1 Tax=Corynebacterium pseudotuberculosis TaxID=1719 RepID=UPI002416BBA9|nr:DUF5979 domain-containing protein [Corynebacterium pseudotuberculosis]WFP66871.1 DUF5979 domain-containing protein [Corynebacterium pseudotuberculosis]
MNLEVPLSASAPMRKPLFYNPVFKTLVVAVVVVLVAALCAVIPRAVAQERKECAANYTDLKWREGSPGVNYDVYDQKSGRAEVEFRWSVNEDTKKGDQFKITLPPQLVTVATGPLYLKDEKGETVATAVISNGQKEVIFTLTDYVRTNFQVKGSAFFTVEWDRTANGLITQGFGKSEKPGILTFKGCGEGGLLGLYAPDGPPGVTHRNFKAGVRYDNPIQINGKTLYLFAWTIFVGSDTGKTDFTVEDTPPEGHKVACSGDFDHGRAPVYLDAIRNANTDPDKHYIVDGSGNTVGGTHNMTGVVSENIPYGDGYEINCVPEKLKVRFPYGVDPATGPRINLITYTEKMPEPGSAVINKARIKGNDIEGIVFIPSAGGWAEGKKGGFAVRKRANGLNPDSEKQFIFEWSCSPSDDLGKVVKSGVEKIENGKDFHVSDLDKGLICKVSEKDADIDGFDRKTTWTVSGNKVEDGKVEFPVREKTEDAVVVEAVNTYTKQTEPKNGSFKIIKIVNGLPSEEQESNYKFNYTCTKGGVEVASGAKEISGAGESTVENLPEGASCAVTEDQESAQVEGYSLVVETGAPAVITSGTTGTVTVNNTYSKKVGSFSITKKLVDPDGVATGKKFTFDYKCVNEELDEVKEGVLGPIGAGEEAKAENIPAGSICTVTEKNADVDKADLKVSGLDSITIVDNKEEKIVATNEYSAWRASLKLNKKILGPQSGVLLNKTFDVDYVCTLGSYSKNGTVTISAKKPAEITDVRSGATCKFTEKTDTAKVEGFEFDLSASTTTAEVTAGDKGTVRESTLVNSYDSAHDDFGRISLTKKVSGLGSVLSGSSQNPREFDVEVSWTDEKGVKQTREVKISEGRITNLDPLPVGTELLLKEKMPKNTAFTTWSTPGFSTTNRGVELQDHGDGTATLLVSNQTVREAALIEVHNTANIPWWWILVPTLPLFIPPLLSSDSSSSSTPATQATSTPQPAPKEAPNAKEPEKKPKKLLAKTGSETVMVMILGMLAILTGLILVIRRRSEA